MKGLGQCIRYYVVNCKDRDSCKGFLLGDLPFSRLAAFVYFPLPLLPQPVSRISQSYQESAFSS